MQRDFEIRLGITLVQPPHEIDLHNFYGFTDLQYSVAERTLLLRWKKSQRDGVPAGLPATLSIEFREVSDFRFMPRDEGRPFTEDDCIASFGYWSDADWAKGVIICDPPQTPDAGWLTAISFMSGAVMAVQAASAHATIEGTSQLQRIGQSQAAGRELFSLALPDFASLPEALHLPSAHFIAFLAADAAGIDQSALAEFSRKLLRAGCVYFCAWGRDCERVHDVFDSECAAVEPVIMTTWHAQESLDEALWFFVSGALPDDGYEKTTRSAVAITIGRPEWDEKIQRRLADTSSLAKDVAG